MCTVYGSASSSSAIETLWPLGVAAVYRSIIRRFYSTDGFAQPIVKALCQMRSWLFAGMAWLADEPQVLGRRERIDGLEVADAARRVALRRYASNSALLPEV